MSIFASLLQTNHSLAQTRMRPYNPYQDTWNEESATQETNIDAENDGAAWINNAKDRTHSIISNLGPQDVPLRHVRDVEYKVNTFAENPSQLTDFYDSETFESRFGQESETATEEKIPKKFPHTTPTITEGQQSDSNVCSCCQLPRAPGSSQGTPASPRLHHTPKDLGCACYCPDIKMPKEMMDSPPSQKPHIRRRSSLSNEGFANWPLRHNGEIKCADQESIARNEMSIGAWL